MNDRPTAAEIVAGVRQYLEAELLPTLSDQRLKFQTLVAANVLAIAERELRYEEEQLVREWKWLAPVLGVEPTTASGGGALKQTVRDGNRELCARIRNGAFDTPPRFRALAFQLRQDVAEKLRVANPRYLSAFQPKPPTT